MVVFEPSYTTADDLIERMAGALSAPIAVTDTIALGCRASIGSADTRTAGYDAAGLLAAADAAVYEVKRAHQRVRGDRSAIVRRNA